MKKLFLVLVISLVGGSLLSLPAAGGPESSGKAGPVVVGRDGVGDWGANVYPGVGEVGDLLGQDLVEASIEMADARTVNFIIGVTSLPGVGGVPEITRYLWEMSVDGNYYLLDSKFTNYSRGTCDPIDGECPSPRDPGMYPVIVKIDCGWGGNAVYTYCREIGLVHAEFDTASSTITIPVPLRLIRARVGSRIAAGSSLFAPAWGGSVVAAPSAWITRRDMPGDAMDITRPFVVPRR